MSNKPLLIIVAGPNGAGKTTFIEKISSEILKKTTFVNADNIAKKYRDIYPSKTEERINFMAGKETVKTYERFFKEKQSFSMETTLSGNSPIQYLKTAKENGYETSLIYIGIDSPENAKIRIENRVLNGGHNIPDVDIVRRYARSMNNLNKAIKYCDKIKVYDNSSNKHQLIFELEGQVVKSVENIELPQWLMKIINIESLKIGSQIKFEF